MKSVPTVGIPAYISDGSSLGNDEIVNDVSVDYIKLQVNNDGYLMISISGHNRIVECGDFQKSIEFLKSLHE